MQLAHNIIVAIVLTVVLPGGNVFVAKIALIFTSFDFLYKIVNLLIALITFHIQINWYISHYPAHTNPKLISLNNVIIKLFIVVK